jgi:hypothetical protein
MRAVGTAQRLHTPANLGVQTLRPSTSTSSDCENWLAKPRMLTAQRDGFFVTVVTTTCPSCSRVS